MNYYKATQHWSLSKKHHDSNSYDATKLGVGLPIQPTNDRKGGVF